MIRKTIAALAVGAGVLGMGASSAFALDCVNASRPAPAQPANPAFVAQDGTTVWVVQGDWWFISFGSSDFTQGAWDKVPPGTFVNVLNLPPSLAASVGLPAGVVNGNYQGGAGFGLLDNAQAPCNANRQTTHGIQAESLRCAPPPGG